MPNWCDTTYRAVGTKEQVKKFFNLATISWGKSKDDNRGWLGHFVTELDGDWEKIYCRGWMLDKPYLSEREDEDYAECTIYTDCAWHEMDEWRHFIEKKIDGLFLYYLAIEPGMALYYSNDNQYQDKYYVDVWEDGSQILSKADTINYINSYFKQKFNTIEECINFADEYEDKDGNQILWIHPMEIYDD